MKKNSQIHDDITRLRHANAVPSPRIELKTTTVEARYMLRWGGTGKGSYIYCIRTKAEKVMGFEYPDVITVALVFVHRMN